jgi:hypothetical protein
MVISSEEKKVRLGMKQRNDLPAAGIFYVRREETGTVSVRDSKGDLYLAIP